MSRLGPHAGVQLRGGLFRYGPIRFPGFDLRFQTFR
jgi:hypothetical protein